MMRVSSSRWRTLAAALTLTGAASLSAPAHAADFDLSCPAGKVMTGVQGELGTYWFAVTVIGKVQPVCRSITAEGSWVDDQTAVMPPQGDGGGEGFELLCSPNYAVFGISGMVGHRVDSLSIHCFPVPTWMQVSSSFANSEQIGPVGGDGGDTSFLSLCQNPQPTATALRGTVGGSIQELAVACGPPPWGAVTATPQNYFPEAEAPLPSTTPEFQWSLILNAHNYHLCITSGNHPEGVLCDTAEIFTPGENQAQFSYVTPVTPLNLQGSLWGFWTVQACNGNQECGPWSPNTSFLAPLGGGDPGCSCNVDNSCSTSCDCDTDCPCVGDDLTFFGNGQSGDLCSVYHDLRCQNCHSENQRAEGVPAPPAGNHFPNVNGPAQACSNCHLRNRPNQWFTPFDQDFETDCLTICQNLHDWAEDHDIAEHLSLHFDPRIEWGFDPAGFSSTDNSDVTALPPIGQMSYDTFITTSQDWIADGMCCAPGAVFAAVPPEGPGDSPGGGGGGEGDRDRRDIGEGMAKLPIDFFVKLPRLEPLDPPKPDPKFDHRRLVRSRSLAGGPLSMEEQRALRRAGLRDTASRKELESAVASLRGGGKVTAPAGRPSVRSATLRGRKLDTALLLEPILGRPVSVTLEGKNLDQVVRVNVLQDGRSAKGLRVRVRKRTASTLDIEVEPLSGVKLETGYEIELVDRAGSIRVEPRTFQMRVRTLSEKDAGLERKR